MVTQSPRVFISYAHETDSPAHSDQVRQLYQLLRENGIDAHWDSVAASQRQDWALWMADHIRQADRILVIASPTYRLRAEGRVGPDVGRGVQWEARLIRDAFYRDQTALHRFVPVILPGQSPAGVPDFLAPATSTVYHVLDFTIAGAEDLFRLLTGQPAEIEPPLGPVPVLPHRSPPGRRREGSPSFDVNRFVLPLDGEVLLADDGFLLPATNPAWQTREHRPMPVGDLLAGDAGFVLLAPGGAGKSTVFRGLADFETGTTPIDVAPLTRARLESLVADVCRHGAAGYLDGLDQAASTDPLFLRWLENELTTAAARRVPWRLACRSAAWDASLAQVLQRDLPGFAEWKLLPLDRNAARTAVEGAIHKDGAAFVQAAVAAGLGRLSGCAGQLIAVARYWDAQGELPGDAVVAMDFELRYLLKETDGRLRPDLPVDRAMRIAKRLGAFTMFAGTQALTASPAADSATLAVNDLPSEVEPAEPIRSIEPGDYRDVLNTALFDTGPSGSVVFRHQRYMEYLAAAYLVERRVHADRVPELLGVPASGRLPTARIGVAAWLAALRPSLIDRLLVDNAVMFAASAAVTELPSDDARAAVVAAVLAAAAGDEESVEWSVDPSALVHSGLDEQLGTCLAAGPQTSEQLWWIARLAEAGHCRGIAPMLARTALDFRWYAYARRAAVAAVGVIGDDDVRLSLRELLLTPGNDETDHDLDNEVRAAVIDVLYPRLLSTTELTDALRPHPSGLIGGYWQTLRELPDRIPDVDLALFVTWLAERTEQVDPEGEFRDLYDGVLRRAWYDCDDETVRRALAHLVTAGVMSGQWLHSPSRRHGLAWTGAPATRRRALAVDIASRECPAFQVIDTSGLLNAGDSEWLLDVLHTVSPPTADSLADCLSMLLHDPSAHIADRILGLSPEHPAYDATAHLRGGIDVQSTGIQLYRDLAAREHKWQQEQADRRQRVTAELDAALDRLATDNKLWWRVAWLLASDGTDDVDRLVGHDLTERPGWAALDANQRERVLDEGIRYLHAHQPTPQTSLGPPWNLTAVMPEWSGVYLLTTLLRHADDRLVQLPPDVWGRWVPAIVVTPVFFGGSTGELRCRLLDMAPRDTRQAMCEAALRHLDVLEANNDSLTPYDIYAHLATGLAPDISNRLSTTATDSRLNQELLTLLVQHGPADTALDMCRRLISEHSPLAGHARTHLAELDPNGVVDTVAWSRPGPEELADALHGLRIDRLDHGRLVIVARLLLDAYPYAQDPPRRSGLDFTPRDHARHLRDRIIGQLASSGNVDELSALQQGRSEVDKQIVNYHLLTAKGRQADISLKFRSPDVLMGLLRTDDPGALRTQ
ncbi:MAG TPA: toll/interleukin-1 receptor domain-containing protein [Pseudonocardiaceae bacterium]|nr:toll/interleukin-1 receptor domain-containing protein [Pseudonocardiaceae bacterium]